MPGVVTAVLVEEGARVRRGQALARIDATEVTSGVQQAKESVAKAERDLERARKLHASGAIPLIEVQNAETGAAVSRAGLAAASFNAARATLIAPDDGVVDSRRIEVGEVVSPGRPVFQLSGRSRGWVVKVGLPDGEVMGIREGEPARVRVDAGDFGELRGHVREVSNASSARTGTFEVEVAIDDAPDGLRSGLSAKVEIDRSERPVVHVPISAVAGVRGSDGAVFVLDGEQVKRVPVVVSGLVGSRALLSRGPAPGAMVVTEGAAKLADGSRVKLAAGDVT